MNAETASSRALSSMVSSNERYVGSRYHQQHFSTQAVEDCPPNQPPIELLTETKDIQAEIGQELPADLAALLTYLQELTVKINKNRDTNSIQKSTIFEAIPQSQLPKISSEDLVRMSYEDLLSLFRHLSIYKLGRMIPFKDYIHVLKELENKLSSSERLGLFFLIMKNIRPSEREEKETLINLFESNYIQKQNFPSWEDYIHFFNIVKYMKTKTNLEKIFENYHTGILEMIHYEDQLHTFRALLLQLHGTNIIHSDNEKIFDHLLLQSIAHHYQSCSSVNTLSSLVKTLCDLGYLWNEIPDKFKERLLTLLLTSKPLRIFDLANSLAEMSFDNWQILNNNQLKEFIDINQYISKYFFQQLREKPSKRNDYAQYLSWLYTLPSEIYEGVPFMKKSYHYYPYYFANPEIEDFLEKELFKQFNSRYSRKTGLNLISLRYSKDKPFIYPPHGGIRYKKDLIGFIICHRASREKKRKKDRLRIREWIYRHYYPNAIFLRLSKSDIFELDRKELIQDLSETILTLKENNSK